MKIVIAGGRDEADFLIASLLKKRHKLIVINNDRAWCEHLSSVHNIEVFFGNPSKKYILRDAEVADSDVLIALTPDDAANLAVCQYAKKQFSIKKVICTVSNPKNVDIFKQLGVDTVISATYMIAEYIEQATTIENLIKTLSIEDEKVLLNEVIVGEDYSCVGKKVMDLSFPSNAIISCIIRGKNMLVPGGATVIEANDKLLVMTSPDSQKRAINAIIK